MAKNYGLEPPFWGNFALFWHSEKAHVSTYAPQTPQNVRCAGRDGGALHPSRRPEAHPDHHYHPRHFRKRSRCPGEWPLYFSSGYPQQDIYLGGDRASSTVTRFGRSALRSGACTASPRARKGLLLGSSNEIRLAPPDQRDSSATPERPRIDVTLVEQ